MLFFTDEQEETFLARPAVKIVIPDHLKSILVDDWEFVTKNRSLVPLPSPHPVNSILDLYFSEEKGRRRLGSAEADLLEEVVIGLKDYFENCLGRILLYRFEREQYLQVRKGIEKDDGQGDFGGKKIGDIYGAEHLCRLFGGFGSSRRVATNSSHTTGIDCPDEHASPGSAQIA